VGVEGGELPRQTSQKDALIRTGPDHVQGIIVRWEQALDHRAKYPERVGWIHVEQEECREKVHRLAVAHLGITDGISQEEGAEGGETGLGVEMGVRRESTAKVFFNLGREREVQGAGRVDTSRFYSFHDFIVAAMREARGKYVRYSYSRG